MARKIVRRSIYDHPSARPVNSAKGAEPTSVAGRASETTHSASRHAEAMKDGKLSRNYEGLPYQDPYCIYVRKDGTSCKQLPLNGHDICLGHMRSAKRDDKS
jgi:hypothetical protein